MHFLPAIRTIVYEIHTKIMRLPSRSEEERKFRVHDTTIVMEILKDQETEDFCQDIPGDATPRSEFPLLRKRRME